MDFAELRLFLHLSRSLHFGRTSSECHISASGLSRAIQRLERDLGHVLFERDNRSLRPRCSMNASSSKRPSANEPSS